MKHLLVFLVAPTLWAVASLGRAEPWSVSYEGNDFPENEPGWERVHGTIPAERWLQDGSLVIDSRQSVQIYDFYEMVFDHPVDPQSPNERFSMTWRLKVDQETGYGGDPGIGITSDEDPYGNWYSVGFTFTTSAMRSAFEGTWVPFAPGVFHTYELTSDNMRSYQLYIDSELATTGSFAEVYGPARVGWGDFVQGGTSLAEWDYVRCGVTVPELSTGALALGAAGLWVRRRS